MKLTSYFRLVFAFTVAFAAAVLSACGGGDSSLTPSESFVERIVTEAPVAGRLSATTAVAKQASATVAITNNQLFQWAQLQYPELFGSAAPNVIGNLLYAGRFFDVREFQGGAYLGISEGRVFGLGPFTNGQLVDFGNVQSYSKQVCSRIGCSGPASDITTIPALLNSYNSVACLYPGEPWQQVSRTACGFAVLGNFELNFGKCLLRKSGQIVTLSTTAPIFTGNSITARLNQTSGDQFNGDAILIDPYPNNRTGSVRSFNLTIAEKNSVEWLRIILRTDGRTITGLDGADFYRQKIIQC